MTRSLPLPCSDIPALLERLARDDLDGPALSFYRGRTLDGELDRAALAKEALCVAGHLHAALGIRRGDRLALLTPNRLEVPVLLLAALRLGVVVVPLNPTSPPEDWSYILAHSGARGLCATAELLGRLPPSAPALEFTLPIESLRALAGGPLPPAESLAEAPAVVLYTSGTTGHPKGVVLSHANLLANAWSMAQNFALDGTTQLAVLPLYHAHAFGFGLMTSLLTFGHLVCAEKLDPFSWAEVIRAREVVYTSVVPNLLPLLLAARVRAERVPSLRAILVSSAPLSAPAARDFEAQTGIPLVQGWGLSEYTNFACCLPPLAFGEEHRALFYGRELPSIGPALAGTEVMVVGGAGETLGEGERGELCVRGPSRMLEYFRDPEATARTLLERGDGAPWLRTGDEGYFAVHEGRPVYYVSGRLKEIIIRGGEKYSPLALERRLLSTLPELHGRLVVLGFPHRAHGEEIGAYAELDELQGELRTRLVAAVETMEPEQRPKVILHGPSLIPRTHTGKIQRRKLVPLYAEFVETRGALKIERRG